MNTALEGACLREGWEAVYAPWFPNGLPNPSSGGEIYTRSPFPFSNDNNPSFQLNVRNGLWTDFHAERITGVKGGNIVQFVAFMTTARRDQAGKPVPDYGAAERTLKVRFGVGAPVDQGWLDRCRSVVADQESPCHLQYRGTKPWAWQTLVNLGVGYDAHKRRFAIPVQEYDGKVANCRMYRPIRIDDRDPKMLWENNNYSGNFLFPHCAWLEDWAILVEGEPDTISLRSFGYKAVSGTGASGNPVPEGNWWVGKRVWVWMDDDEPGHKASETCIRILSDGATEVRLVQWPEWPGKSDKADPSEYIMYLLGAGYSYEQVQSEVTKLLQEAKSLSAQAVVYDMHPVDVPFHEVLTARNMDTRLRFNAHVVTRSGSMYTTPTRVAVACPGSGWTMCNRCPMNSHYHGNAVLQLDARSPLSLKTIMVPEYRRDSAIREHLHIPVKCEHNRVTIQESADVGVVVFTNTMSDISSTSFSFSDQKRHEGFVLMSAERPDMNESADYSVVGYVRSMPSSQKSVLLVDSFERQNSLLTSFNVNSESVAQLQGFVPSSTVDQKLVDVAEELASSVTMIRGRFDLHMFFRCVYHSVVAFNFAGSVHKRGWLEGLVVGDTRCGKSQTFSRLSEMYGTGVLVDSKMQTTVGLLGSVETSQITGERYVVAGLFARQDCMGPICLDEYSLDKGSRSSMMMDSLSSTRASGTVVISKAASATFSARCRLVVMANPGAGKLMRDMAGEGVEILPRLIPQPEDIARFDMAMAVSQEDVPMEQINTAVRPTAMSMPPEAHRALLAWVWSRRPEQVVWAPGAEPAVLQLAADMCKVYDDSVPIVEPSDQRMRVAKLAVSVAAQCFSTDAMHELLVVRPEHVYTAGRLFATWYDKKTFGYNEYSHRFRLSRNILDPAAVWQLLDQVLGEHSAMTAMTLARTHMFTERTFDTILPLKFTEVHSTIQKLVFNRCIRLNQSHGDHYEVTPAFSRLLKEYAEAKGGNSVRTD